MGRFEERVKSLEEKPGGKKDKVYNFGQSYGGAMVNKRGISQLTWLIIVILILILIYFLIKVKL